MIIVVTCVVAVAVIVFILGVRAKDLPQPEPESPFKHLDERKAAIYENLRDLQFEYRLGKLSDEDYQSTKKDLQKELAVVLAEVDELKNGLGVGAKTVTAVPAPKKAGLETGRRLGGPPYICPECGASFEKELKFCGECGKPMKAVKA